MHPHWLPSALSRPFLAKKYRKVKKKKNVVLEDEEGKTKEREGN
jgi:hypothetical protein